jgi:hypothetical protein
MQLNDEGAFRQGCPSNDLLLPHPALERLQSRYLTASDEFAMVDSGACTGVQNPQGFGQ